MAMPYLVLSLVLQRSHQLCKMPLQLLSPLRLAILENLRCFVGQLVEPWLIVTNSMFFEVCVEISHQLCVLFDYLLCWKL
jgi:hypothetical protein